MRIIVFLAILCGCLHADDTINLKVDGLERLYQIHVPNRSDPMPVVLMLHGAGGTAALAATRNGWTDKSDQEGFIAVFPQALPFDLTKPSNPKTNPNVWNDGFRRTTPNDINYLAAVIQDVKKRHPVDPKRIYCTGFSSGASMTFYAGIELSETLAAIAPVSGHLFIQNPHPKRLMSMMLITGDADPLNPLNGGPALNPWSSRERKTSPMIESVDIWLKLLNIKESQKTEITQDDALITKYGPNSSGLKVIYIVIAGQGHVWPGGTSLLPESVVGKNKTSFSATNAIWDFFKTQAQRSE